MVFAEPAGSCCTNASIVCALCGIAMPDLPFVDSDYFNVVIIVGRPLGHVARFRRARQRSRRIAVYSHHHPPSSRRFR